MNQQLSPQDYLDDMRAIGVPRLFQAHLDARERAAGIRRARQELGQLRTELTLRRDSRDRQGVAQRPEERRRQNAPFNLLLLLHEQLLAEVNDLEHSLSNGKPLPYSFQFGQFIFGDEAAGEWYIGTQAQYDDWQRIQRFKRRLDALREQSQPLRETLGGIRIQLDSLTQERDKTKEQIDRRKSRAYVLRQILLLLALAIACFIVGWRYIDIDRDFATVAFVALGVCLLMLPLVVANWKNPRTRLNSRRRKLESDMRDLQYEGGQQRQRYQPLELQMKAMEVHYNRMMDSWQEARLIKGRLDSFIDEAQPLRDRVGEIRDELAALRQKREKLMRAIEARNGRGAFAQQMALLILLALASGGAGYYLHQNGLADYATGAFGIAVVCLALLPLAALLWRRRDSSLESRLRQVEAEMRLLQTEGKAVMKRYHPMELQIKTLIAQYKRMRAGLQNTPNTPDS